MRGFHGLLLTWVRPAVEQLQLDTAAKCQSRQECERLNARLGAGNLSGMHATQWPAMFEASKSFEEVRTMMIDLVPVESAVFPSQMTQQLYIHV
jgi:hypothetical protein